MKKILSRIEYGYVYIYDFDIKGYFDNIPHKKLMKVLNKYVSDGTVLDMIWKWLKAGYMEDGVRFNQTKGTQQGGVISPLLANIYLNELDWELDKANHEFVRYADDALIMCKTPEELEKAKALVKRVLDELGLEIAEDKTKDVDFHNDDFEFLGFKFEHLRISKKGDEYYIIKISESGIKKFKSDIKSKSKKSWTFSFEKWKEILNPVIRGKFNYYLKAMKAKQAVEEVLESRGLKCKCIVSHNEYKTLDGYVRQRLRVAFSCRGKKNGCRRDGKLLTVKYDNLFFLKEMGLVSGHYMFNLHNNNGITIEEYCMKTKRKNQKRTKSSDRFFRYALAK
ncbi:RNA-directed DNA polymerase [Breznakia sp. PH1-1]|nr:RNA-directed DNA polymerase [Breznakia sp. PH1-1]MDH6404598.1 RNA-directed DNA polymerase [Breznakia sp. PF1-11]MDH6412307.1 RNA-directed DNA polymerase [Breznakia sp. PFB1-11]MDH6414645.1 RNA-directed DNA polymerase [Breznakia sp. PFB1-14]MDH6416960.1 RNA-directed DNA polymerase [Breznakia sp. PFB1-4]MDH6419340.1 RNA-directed DNA polymerase [Breznakia sp. PFB1-12]MDH6474266.1 RNA-directed DNA polymerase [Breznakia sp. PFB2-30]MDH6476747.1 RNA-directed DNA polymerase [Breznakia sp. PFB1-1